MKRVKEFIVGLSSGTVVLLMLMAMPLSAFAMVPDWELRCDFSEGGGAICCSVNTSTGEIGECRVVL